MYSLLNTICIAAILLIAQASAFVPSSAPLTTTTSLSVERKVTGLGGSYYDGTKSPTLGGISAFKIKPKTKKEEKTVVAKKVAAAKPVAKKNVKGAAAAAVEEKATGNLWTKMPWSK